jgi:FOG: Ankyrin repeat
MWITLNAEKSLICSFCVVRILLEDPRTSVDTAEKKGQTALHIAALKGNYEVMEMLLGMTKVDVNAADEAGCTALHSAGLQVSLRWCGIYVKGYRDHTTTASCISLVLCYSNSYCR